MQFIVIVSSSPLHSPLLLHEQASRLSIDQEFICSERERERVCVCLSLSPSPFPLRSTSAIRLSDMIYPLSVPPLHLSFYPSSC